MIEPLFTPKMTLRLMATLTFVGVTVAVLPAPRFQSEVDKAVQTPFQKELFKEFLLRQTQTETARR